MKGADCGGGEARGKHGVGRRMRKWPVGRIILGVFAGSGFFPADAPQRSERCHPKKR